MTPPPGRDACTGPANGLESCTITVDDVAVPAQRMAVDIGFSVRPGAVPRDTLPATGPGMQDGCPPLKVRILADGRDAQATQPDYAMLETLGQGGMGEVAAARQLNLNRVIAIKRLPEDRMSSRHQDRLFSEALITSSLDHPNIVPVYDLGLDQHGRPFFAMKKVRGKPWSACCRRLTEQENLDILLRVCDAIAFAHANGVVHRDLKPDNIMIGEFGEVLVMDWGLAIGIAQLRDTAPHERFANGSPAYMAPEMALADYGRIGPRSDIYLLGAILFELSTHQPPHPGEDIRSCLIHAANNVIVPGLPHDELADIALKAMASDPDARFQDVRAFQSALRALRAHAESNRLCDSAQESFRTAIRTGRHDQYARAIACYDQALVLWADNRRAQAGLLKTRHAFAEHALATDDLDLAFSLTEGLGPAIPLEQDGLRTRVSAAYRARRTLRRRMRFWTGAAMAASALVLIIAVTAALLTRAEQSRMIAAIHDRDTAEMHLAAMERRAWESVLAEDFTGHRMPAAVHSLKGAWSLNNDRLVAVGPETALAELAASGAGSLRLSFDQINDHGVILYLDVDHDDLPDHPDRSRITVLLSDNVCHVYRRNAEMASAPLPPIQPHLPRHVIAERDQGAVRVLIDGKTVIDNLEGFEAGNPGRSRIAIAAQAGAGIDNLRVDRLDPGQGVDPSL